MKCSRFLIVALSLLLLFFKYNYPQDIKFDHLTMEDGITSTSVRCIFQDSRGFLWFGTQAGLNKYDGYNFTMISSDPKDSLSLNSDDINDICEDNRENLWVATSKGLNKIGMESGKITRINSEFADFYSITENKKNVMYFDQQDNLWIGTREGLFRLTFHQKSKNANQFKIQHFRSDTTKSNTLVNNIIQTICEDKKGNLWIGTQGGLHKYNPVQEIFTVYRHDPLDNHSISHNDVRSVFEDSEGILWIGTWRGWLNRFDPTSGKFTHYVDNRLTHILSIAEDLNGNLWFGSGAQKGLSCLLKKENKFRYFRPDPADKNSLNGRYISDLFVDNSGILWIATVFGDLNIYDPQKRKFEHYYHIPSDTSSLNGNYIWSICEDKTGKVWLALQQKGVDCFDPVTGKFIHYEHNPGDPNSLNSNLVHPIYEDNSGSLWVGTSRGLARFIPEINKFRRYSGNPGKHSTQKSLLNNNILSIYEDEEENLWMGTLSGLNCMDRQSGKITQYFINPLDRNNIFDNMAIIVHKDKRGIFWINTYHGLYTFDKSNKKFTSYIIHPENHSKIRVNCIAEDDHNFWFGTEVGLIKIDKVSGRRYQYTKQDGLPDNEVVGLLFDDNGLLWISTLSGLCSFNPVSETFRHYSLGDGLQSLDYNAGAFHKGRSGYFYFGGCNGFNRFHPDSVRDNQFIPPVVISSIKLLKQDISTPPFNDLSKTIELSYDQHDFMFEYVALNYTNSSENQYAYKLDGYDKEWIYCGRQRIATYTNLDPGAYTFQVIGSNNDGLWNEEGASITLTILPPWWQTNWAYAAYLIIFALTLYALRTYDQKRQRLKHDLEIELLHGEKLEEVDHMKSRFFANISHEFRTPLTLILGPVEQMLSGKFKGNIKEQYKVIIRNARRLLQLINQLLDLSKLESGKLKLQAQSTEIISLTNGLVQAFESLAVRKGISLKFNTKMKSQEVYIDVEKFETIINNLVGNAFKFTPENGKIDVDICRGMACLAQINNVIPAEAGIQRGKLHQESWKKKWIPHQVRDDKFIQITIINTGPGIPSDKIDKIFDRFYQINESYTKDEEGTGIGLALTKELVELHHGTIEVQCHRGGSRTAPTSGELYITIFSVKIPIGNEHLSAEEIVDKLEREIPDPGFQTPQSNRKFEPQKSSSDQPEPRKESRETSTESRVPSILVVEDNTDLRRYISSHLNDQYRIIEAEDGEKGLRMALKEIPDLIISDVMMPKMDGFEFCTKIKTDQRTSHIPVILLTARASLEDKIEGLETGADDYLSKPFNVTELLIRVKNLIEQRQKLRKRFPRDTILKLENIEVSSADEAFLKKSIAIIQDHLSEPEFNVNLFSKEIGFSRSQLHRKMVGLTNMVPNHFIRLLRLHHAKQLFDKSAATVSEIAYESGFGNLSYFARCFKEQFGQSPSDYGKNNLPG